MHGDPMVGLAAQVVPERGVLGARATAALITAAGLVRAIVLPPPMTPRA
jgi:hypothetical protein